MRLLALALALGPIACAPPSVPPPDEFWVGANMPWHHYGHDIGDAWGSDGIAAAESNARVRADLRALSAAGATVVRWFFFADGRAINAETGLTARAMEDLDALFAALDDHDVDVVPVLFDYLWLDGAQEVDGVQLFGRAADVRDPSALLQRVVAPLVERYGEHPRVRAWEVINEPEWAMHEHWVLAEDPVEPAEMHAFVKRVGDALRAGSQKPVTVGSASLDDMMSLWADTDLELLSFHRYQAGRLDIARDSLGVDVPVLLSELPSNDIDLAQAIEDARRLGYLGAFPWSLNGDDAKSDRVVLLEAVSPP